MAKTKLIPGYRFHPTDVELVQYFLKRKVMGKKFSDNVIAEIQIYKYAPWDLPDKSYLRTGDLEWYFFCPSGMKYASGTRMNRATDIGYWKSTGRDRSIQHNNQTVGMIKTLVFHTGKVPHGDRTNWVIHEYRLKDKDLTDKAIPQDSYVICKVFQKEGPGPRNGAQYGKPFNEEDWDDEVEELDCVESVPFASVSAPVPIVPMISNSSVSNDMHLPPSGCIGSTSMSCLSGSMSFPCPENPSDTSNQAISNDDDILSMLDSFKEDNTLPLNENSKIEDSYVICNVFQTEGPGPRNGAQYEEPFNEEDRDDEVEEIDCVESVPFASVFAPVPIVPVISNSSVSNDMHLPPSGCIGSTSMSCLSGLMSFPCPANPSDTSNQAISSDDDILSMLDSFNEDNTLPLNENNKTEDSYVICNVFQKEGLGPRNGAQYGKPLNEDWDDEVEEIDCVESVLFASVSAPVPIVPVRSNSSVSNDMHLPPSGCIGSTSMLCLSGSLSFPCPENPSDTSNQAISNDDDILSMLDSFKEDNTLPLNENSKIEDSYVICKVFQKEGPGPRHGAQYGKPYNEEDWDEEEIDCVESVPFASVSAPVPIVPMISNSYVSNDMHLPPSGCIGSTSMSCLSGSMSFPCPANPSDTSNQAISNDDDILSMLDSFKEDNTLPLNENNKIEENNAEGAPLSDFFEGLGDLNNWFGLGEDGHGFSSGQKAEYTTNQVVTAGDVISNCSNGSNNILSLPSQILKPNFSSIQVSRCAVCQENGDCTM